MEYLLSLIIISLIPSAIVLYFRRHLVKPLLKLYPLFLIIGFVWDSVAISRGWWSYGEAHLIGYKIAGVVPVEDLLFFVLVPTSAICIYDIFFGIGREPAIKRNK